MFNAESSSFLCKGCPGKGNLTVDPDVLGSCPRRSLDSFLQTRSYRIEDPEIYANNEEMAELSSQNLRYYDLETDESYSETGDIDAARLGIACAEKVLRGECPRSISQILRESEID